MYFQDIISNLSDFWAKQGCVIQQPYDMEKGAGTMSPPQGGKAYQDTRGSVGRGSAYQSIRF